MKEYFGWPGWWMELEEVMAAQVPLPSPPVGREFPVSTGEDSNLRSANFVVGYELWACHGEIGRLKSFIVDESSWHIGYMDVQTGDWLHGRSMMVPTSSVTSVSWAGRRVNLRQAGDGI